MTDELSYEIDNIGGVEHVELRLRPGVNVLRGRNASGKTSALNAVVRATGGEVEIERRDGATAGQVIGPGVQMRVGKVVKRTGTAELSLADVAPLSTLINPGLKDSDAAARARIRALTDLLGVTIDDHALEVLCGGSAEAMEWLRDEVSELAIDSLDEAAAKLRGWWHARTREWEARAEQDKGKAIGARDAAAANLAAAGGTDRIVDISPEEAQASRDEALQRYERARGQVEAREDLEARQEALRETIGERPEPAITRDAWRAADGYLAKAEAEIGELEAALAKARERRATKRAEAVALAERVEAEEKALERWNEAQRVLSEQLDGPTREELETSYRSAVAEATDLLARARASAAYRESQSAIRDIEASGRAAEEEALERRAAAAAIPARLGELLAEAGADGITVIDGRLHLLVDGKPLDWEMRLSEGQRVDAALAIATRRYSDRVWALSAGHWAALDPERRAALHEKARERGLYVLTEEPASGELRVEQK